jgi:serine phosphatase RsbU (regulator of sigma subunit)/predicted enzyme related to lactoylglutathione lyase
MAGMGSASSVFKAHRCSFHPDRQDPYLRLGSISVFVRNQDESLRFFIDNLGFGLAFDTPLPSGDRWLAVTPPDGTGVLSLRAPEPGSDECKLIGRPTQIVFVTDDILAKYEEWRKRGVRFWYAPREDASGGISTIFEDVNGNSFVLAAYDAAIREIEQQRHAHAAKRESDRHEASEIEFARQVQARLFPQIRPKLATLDYAGVCMQARHVGGDYYDFLDLGRERMGLVIGDVSGKGTAAALLMSNLQAHLRNQCATYWSRPFTPFVLEQPLRFLRAVNSLFYENTTDNAYATLIFAEYDDAARRLRYGNCGHLSGILLRRDNTVERLDSTGTVLGLFKEWNGSTGEHQLDSGDLLALYTDGATESVNHEGEEFGDRRLVNTLQRHRELCPETLLKALTEEIHEFSGHHRHDDLTFIVARCRD